MSSRGGLKSMGHGRAQGILEHFLTGIGDLLLKRVMQVFNGRSECE